MAERRRLTRRYILGEVSIRPFDDGEPIGAEALDVNSGGVGLYLMSEVPANTEVWVSITLNTQTEGHITIEIKGLVQWLRPVGNRFSAGIKFNEPITGEDYPSLYAYIQDVDDDEEED